MDHNIKVEQLEGFPNAEFEVVVENDETTKHHVTVREAYYEELTNGAISSYGLIKNSFVFLLQHEPSDAILSSFDLETIQSYFPEYEEEMKRLSDQTQ